MITIELQQVVDEGNGIYTVVVNAVDNVSGKTLISGKTFQGTSAMELKAAIKPQFEKLIAIEQKKATIRSIAQGVIDEILNEVQQ